MGTKSHHQAMLSRFQDPIDVPFHYLESVGKYNATYQNHQCLVGC